MKLWNKSKFELADQIGLRRKTTNLWPREARDILLKEVVYPIQITECDMRKVYAFTDANGREYNWAVFDFHPTECLFDSEDREFFVKFNYNKVSSGKMILDLVESAHLLGEITVNGVPVTKKGQLVELLKQAKAKP